MKYDPFQIKAIEHVKKGRSVLVTAPTGAGKTVIAEYAIRHALLTGKSAIYTAPIKALSNQKYRDFKIEFGDKIGVITGDVSINASAPVLIMTTEIYRNRLFEEHHTIKNISWIVFDEIHYLDDPQRGTVWEESIMFTPDSINILCLSATIPNIDELAAWIRTIHKRKLATVTATERPVPLTHGFHCQNRILGRVDELRKTGFSAMERSDGRRGGRRRSRPRSVASRIENMVDHLCRNRQLPAIYFAFGRDKTQKMAQRLSYLNLLNEEQRHRAVNLFNEICAKYGMQDEPSARALLENVRRGIAYHHAGMLPPLKDIVEVLFTEKLVKLVFTTETFALGINMPARTVVFDELRKFYGLGFRELSTRDYYQMAGRAGRRGIDEKGFVYSTVVPRYIKFKQVVKIIYGKPEPVLSQFNANYATLLNLFSHMGDGLLDIYPRSFHYFQSSERERKRAVSLLRTRLELLKSMEYIVRGRITARGIFASTLYGYELILGEMFGQGFLEGLDIDELCIILSSVVFEPRKNDSMPRMSPEMRAIARSCRPFQKKVHKQEKRMRVEPLSKPPFFHMSAVMSDWLNGKSLSTLFENHDFDQGEVIRNFRMTIQLLRQLQNNESSPEALRKTAGEGVRLVKRGVVDAEWQLRAGVGSGHEE
jgi:superfamily II RNA helicase